MSQFIKSIVRSFLTYIERKINLTQKGLKRKLPYNMHVNHKWPDPHHNGERSHHKQMVEQMPDAPTSMCWRCVQWFSSSSCWGPLPFWSTVSYSSVHSVNSHGSSQRRMYNQQRLVSNQQRNQITQIHSLSLFYVCLHHEMPINDKNEPY